jgi:hypothetical protein
VFASSSDSRKEWVSLIALIIVSLLALSACAVTHSHPPSASRRAQIYLSIIHFAEKQCLAESGRYCLFDEMRLPTVEVAGPFSVVSASRASTGEYDLVLLVRPGRYCIGAIARDGEVSRDSLWEDNRGKEYVVRYPLKEIPRACRVP